MDTSKVTSVEKRQTDTARAIEILCKFNFIKIMLFTNMVLLFVDFLLQLKDLNKPQNKLYIFFLIYVF